MVRVLLLAAGSGMRYKRNIAGPKCFTEFERVRLIDYQLKLFKDFEIQDLAFATGYMQESMLDFGLPTFYNDEYFTSNMVGTLAKAIKFFDFQNDLIISYTDIIYEPKVLKNLISDSRDFVVVADSNWENLWKIRMHDYMSDVESLVVDQNNALIEIGLKNPPKYKVCGQYIGLIKLTPSAQRKFVQELKVIFPDVENISAALCANISMTELFSGLIKKNWKIYVCWINGGWLEFDTLDDKIAYESNSKTKNFKDIFSSNWYQIKHS
jgi:choline kinase